MVPALSRLSPDRRRRTVAFAAALAAHLLVLFVLLWLPPELRPKAFGEPGAITMISLRPEPKPSPKPSPKRQAAKRAPAASAKAAPPPAPLAKQAPATKLDIMDIDLASSNIANIHSTGIRRAAPTETADAGDDGVTGPNGERLYNADWFREPTQAELETYLPHGVPPKAWGIIACKTVARYRVEDCREIAEWPPGSGMAHGVAEAAWQFRVLPPRVGGNSLVGSWVRIKIFLTGIDK